MSTLANVVENKWELNDKAILLFFYGKAVDLWIAEQGEDSLETDREILPPIIHKIATELYWQYKNASKEMS